MQPGRGSRCRQRSPEAAHALDLFNTLRTYFAYDSALAQALGWDEATAAEWRSRRVVRPQKAKIALVNLLSELCQETRPYLATDLDVGAWINAPLPNLRGWSPARWLRGGGRKGLRQLVYGMVDWMPRVPDGDLDLVDTKLIGALLAERSKDDPGARELQRMLSESNSEAPHGDPVAR